MSTERILPPAHPGQILRDEFLEPLALSVYRLARDPRVPRLRMNDIVLGRRSISTDTALRLGRYFGTTPVFWINLQTRHDLDITERRLRLEIDRETEPYDTKGIAGSLDRAGAP